ncbi:hypothetical protein EC991_003167 [Linnemannia zychae]|nr:hypothetical protein EC991_003167 [Linnemannia zychae]
MTDGLNSITFSSIKTWSAVVDSTDKSRARRHMFLWFLTLAGLSVEPIADSIFSSRIPMYEGVKIIFAGWLLLAHFDISRPEKQPRQSYTIAEDHHHKQLESQHHIQPTISRQSSYISTTERIPEPQRRNSKTDAADITGSTMLRANNLDFGRFKRDLERRRSRSRTHSHVTEEPLPTIPSRTNSQLSHVEPSPSTPIHHPKSESIYTPKSAATLRAASLPRGSESRTSTPTTATPQQGATPITLLQESSAAHSEKRSPLGMFLFGSGEKSRRKRPSSAMSEERPSPSLARNVSNLSSRSQPRPSALQRQRSSGEHRVRINAESPQGKNKRQRHSPDGRGELSEQDEDNERPHTRHTKDPQSSSNAKHTTSTTSASAAASSTPIPAQNTTSTSASSSKFSRSKPPAKGHVSLPPNTSKTTGAASKDHRPQHQSLPETTSRDLFSPSATDPAEEPLQVASASFESRMKNVRAWIKGRNPSMISPTLTATSEATATHHSQLKRRSSSFVQEEKPSRIGKSGSGGLDDLPKITKRKAARQLAPTANPKRWAAEDELERPSQWTVADEDRMPPQQSSTSNSRRRRSRELAALDSMAPVNDRQRAERDYSFSQPTPVVRRNSATRISSDERNRPSSLPTNVDWDRFQKMLGASGHRRRPSSSSSAANTYQRYTRKSSIATLLNQHHGVQDDNSTVAPLIKLRQSQLRQHQEEDFFGVKRKDSGEGRTKFDSALDLWEQEDDETLARNAAREAEEVEARSQLRLSQSRLDSSDENQGSGSPEDERGVFTFTSPSRISGTAATATGVGYEMAAPTPSLLRTIPFNGESSRRPVPEFQPKKSSTFHQETLTIKSSPSRSTSQLNHDISNPFLEKITSGSSSTAGRTAPPPPPRFNFNFAGAASLAKKRAQSQSQPYYHHPQQQQQQAKASPEEVAARRERHPGLYTPSKKKVTSSPAAAAAATTEQGSLWKESHLSQPTTTSPFKKQQPSTPTTMSRYIELSSLSDDD